MKEYFCFRCKKDMPFLDEVEWETISPLIRGSMLDVKKYREEHQCDLATAKKNFRSEATVQFEKLTDYPDVYVSTITHHRLKDMGPECVACGHLFRINKAKFCANCGGTVGKET